MGTIESATADGGEDDALHRSTLDAWLDALISPHTRAAYRLDLETYGRWCADAGALPLAADADTIVAFQAARAADGDSPSTIRRRWSSLSSYYDFARDTAVISSNPTDGLERPRVAAGDPSPTDRLTAEAVAIYQRQAASLDPRLDALVALLVLNGFKVNEALALDVTDLGGSARRPTITLRRKGRTSRVAIHPATARAIRRCAGDRGSGPLFTNHRSPRRSRGASSVEPVRLSRFGADHLIRKLGSGPDDRVTANELRRYHISRHAALTSPEQSRESAGLSSARGVRRYTAPRPSG